MRSLLISLLACFPLALAANPKIKFGDTISTDHLRGGITAATTYFEAAPGHRFKPLARPHRSWLDATARLKLTASQEDEIVHFIRVATGYRHTRHQAFVLPQQQRWLEARFYELRGQEEKALELYSAATSRSPREQIAYGRLLFRSQKTEEALAEFRSVSDWQDFPLEAHLFNIADDLEGLQSLIDLLREEVPATTFRRYIYPLELDLAFHLGTWKEALTQSESLGEQWHLFALFHYGDLPYFQDKLRSLENLSLNELLLYPSLWVGEKIADQLLGGKGDPDTRLRAALALLNTGNAGNRWLTRWIHAYPQEATDWALELALKTNALRPRSGKWTNPIIDHLEKTALDPTRPDYWARMNLIARLDNSEALLDFLKSAPLRDSFPDLAGKSANDLLEYEASISFFPDQHALTLHNDPLLWVLVNERKNFPPEAILSALKDNPHFQSLTLAGKAKYYLFANLHKQLLETLISIDWSSGNHSTLARFGLTSIRTYKQPQIIIELNDQWRKKYLSSALLKDNIYHSQNWARSLADLEFTNEHLREILQRATVRLAQDSSLTQEEILRKYFLSIRGCQPIRQAALQLLGETLLPNPRSEKEEAEDFFHDRLLGCLLFTAASTPDILRANPTRSNRRWGNAAEKDKFLNQLFPSQFLFLSANSYSINRNGYSTNRSSRFDLWTDSEQLKELSRHLSENIQISPRNLAYHLCIHHPIYKSKDNPVGLFFQSWKGPDTPEFTFVKAARKNWNLSDLAQLNQLLETYPPSYLKSRLKAKNYYFSYNKREGAPFDEQLDQKVKLFKFSPQQPFKEDLAREAAEEAIEREDIAEFLDSSILNGTTFLELSDALAIYKDGFGLEQLGRLISDYGHKLSKSDPDRNWKEEAMTYLESLDPLLLTEISNGSSLPLSSILAGDPDFAERYFLWARRAGLSYVRRWGSLPVSLADNPDPDISLRWIREALCAKDTSGLPLSPLSFASTSSMSSSGTKLWSEPAKLNHLTYFADSLLPELRADTPPHLKLLFLAASTDPNKHREIPNHLVSTAQQLQSSRQLSFLNANLQHLPDGAKRLAHIHRLIFNDKRTRFLADIHYLFSSEQGMSRSEIFDQLWHSRDPSALEADKLYRHQYEIIPLALTEASDQIFPEIVTRLANNPIQIDSPHFWGDLLQNYRYADPKRVREVLNLLPIDDRIPRMKAMDKNSYSWWNNLSLITSSAFYSQHELLTKQLLSDYKKISTPENGLHYKNPLVNQLTNSLRRGEPEHLKLNASLTLQKDESVILCWSLFGIDEINEKPVNGVLDVKTSAFDGLFDLHISAITPQGNITNLTLPKVTIPGHTTIPSAKLPAGSKVRLKINKASQKETLLSHTQIFEPVLLHTHEIKTYGFKKSPTSGPFRHQSTWNASHLAQRAANIEYSAPLLAWPTRPDHDFLFTFWLNQGNSRTIWKFLFTDEDGVKLGETTLKNGETALQNVISWAQSTPVWQQATYRIPAAAIPESTRKITLQLEAAGGFFQFTSPKTHWIPTDPQ